MESKEITELNEKLRIIFKSMLIDMDKYLEGVLSDPTLVPKFLKSSPEANILEIVHNVFISSFMFMWEKHIDAYMKADDSIIDKKEYHRKFCNEFRILINIWLADKVKHTNFNSLSDITDSDLQSQIQEILNK